MVKDTRVSSVGTGLTDDQAFGMYSQGEFGTFTAEDDSVTSSGAGIDVTAANATVTGNVITSGSGSSEPGLVVVAGGATAPAAPIVENNTVTAPAGQPAYAVDSPALDFAQLASNSIGDPAQSSFIITGTVSTSQTLPAESYPWLITGIPQVGGDTSAFIDIPAGVTLTVAAGTVVKAASSDNPNINGSVTVEGTLDAIGTAASPITFTSVNDNSIGGDTGTGSPAAGDWDGLWIDNGTADIENATISYASDATSVNGTSTVDLSNAAIQNSNVGITATTGAVGFRGSFAGNSMDIEACTWNSQSCTVDAAYSNWGDGTTGPFPATGALACGAVTVSPWLPQDNTVGIFQIANCDGSQTPDAVLSSAESTYEQDIAGAEVQCGDGFETVCQEVETWQNCYAAAYQLAQAQSPFTLPAIGGNVVDSGSDWLEDSETQKISDIGEVTDRLNDVLGVVSIISDLASAYNTCVA